MKKGENSAFMNSSCVMDGSSVGNFEFPGELGDRVCMDGSSPLPDVRGDYFGRHADRQVFELFNLEGARTCVDTC